MRLGPIPRPRPEQGNAGVFQCLQVSVATARAALTRRLGEMHRVRTRNMIPQLHMQVCREGVLKRFLKDVSTLSARRAIPADRAKLIRLLSAGHDGCDRDPISIDSQYDALSDVSPAHWSRYVGSVARKNPLCGAPAAFCFGGAAAGLPGRLTMNAV